MKRPSSETIFFVSNIDDKKESLTRQSLSTEIDKGVGQVCRNERVGEDGGVRDECSCPRKRKERWLASG